jgi:phospholipase/lecithinase/hemolysin
MSIQVSSGKLLALALVFLSVAAVANADPFSAVVVYGDSLSDNGNLFAASGQPPAPYFQGRRSNGPVAVEQFADALGVPLVDFAWIGATTGIGNYGDQGTTTTTGTFSLPGMQVELAGSLPLIGPYLNDGLFVVWGGANDFLAPSPLDLTPQAVVNRGVANVLGIVTALQGLGAQNILVPGMPDLGLTPFVQGLGPVTAAQYSAITDGFNALLLNGLPSGVHYFDTASLLRSMVADPAAYGFTNVTSPCLVGVTVCANPDEYLFWDDFHPTTATHAFVASGFAKEVVPEPSTLVLLTTAFALCTISRKRIVRGIQKS